MRKFYFSATLLFLIHAEVGAQLPIQRITGSFYKSDPFRTSFGAFISHLVNDPGISSKLVDKKTDSSLFYFHGTYDNFNPFFIKPKRVEVVLSEMSIQLVDTLPADTIFAYQLIAFNDATGKGKKEIMKEFEKIHKYARKEFPSNNYSASTANEPEGGVHNYFSHFHGLAPFTLAWYELADTKEVALILTVRVKAINNEAAMPFGIFR